MLSHKSIACLALAALLLPATAQGGKCAKTRATTVSASNSAAMDIIDTAVSAGSFKTLAAALEAAGLIDTSFGFPHTMRLQTLSLQTLRLHLPFHAGPVRETRASHNQTFTE